MPEASEIFTLKQVVSSIRKTIEDRYARLYWVKAEMHKLNHFPSGHCFPELLQKEDGKIVAEMRGTIWAQQYQKINTRFMEVVKEPLKEDTTLLMQVKVTFHEIYGLSLQILDIDPNYALGELQRERQETLEKLQKLNLLNANQKVPFPLLPKRIAVISADSSKGLSDFMKVLEQNNWGYRYFTLLFPAYLQGDMAIKSIQEQLKRIEKVKHHFDVVVIVRGGGGEVGLSCYNNFELCKSIATFPLPVLTGIGHSTNLTVAEMISYRNAITPTELGEFLIQAFHNFSVPIKDAAHTIKVRSKQILEITQRTFSHLTREFKHVVSGSVQTHREEISKQNVSLRNNTKNYLIASKDILRSQGKSAVHIVKFAFQDNRNLLSVEHGQINSAIRSFIERKNNLIEKAEYSVRLMDPQNVLKRGYSITTINGKTVSSSNQPNENDVIKTISSELELNSLVTSVKRLEKES